MSLKTGRSTTVVVKIPDTVVAELKKIKGVAMSDIINASLVSFLRMDQKAKINLLAFNSPDFVQEQEIKIEPIDWKSVIETHLTGMHENTVTSLAYQPKLALQILAATMQNKQPGSASEPGADR